jgi:hypothetical protein
VLISAGTVISYILRAFVLALIPLIILAIASAILISQIRIDSVQGFAFISCKDAYLFFLIKALPVFSIIGDLTEDFQLRFLLIF